MTFSFKTIQPSFIESYKKVVHERSNDEFLSYYTLRGENLRRTFSEFDQDVRKAAFEIKKTKADQVVIISGNKYEHLVFVVASWILGVPHCPISPLEKADRVLDKLKHLGGKSAVLIDPDLEPIFQFSNITTHPLRWGTETFDYFNLPLQDPSRIMALVFTSGSTGYSKIVEQSEISILSNVDCLIEHHQLGPGKNICTSLPIFHVNALHFSFLCCLLSGAKFILLENFLTNLFSKILVTEKVQIFSLIPTLLQNILHSNVTFDFTSLKYFVSAAAPLSSQLASDIYKKFNIKIVQGYGLSEAVNFSCLLPIDIDEFTYQEKVLKSPIPSIGPALRCNQVLILDPVGNPILNPGQTGEIALTGINLMGGYRNENVSSVNAGIFKTGDLGYFERGPSNHPYFFISGRIKDVIKRNGFTVSLREIDDSLSELMPLGLECIAVPFQHDLAGEEVGLVFNCANKELDPLQNILEKHLKDKFPETMRPFVAICLSDILRTPSGKPLRWKFTDHFKEFKSKPLGKTLRIFDRRVGL